MSIIDDLRKQKGLYLRLPCGDEVRAADVLLFDGTKRLPPEAAELLAARRSELAEERRDLALRKKAIAKTEIAAESVNIGKVVEKITTVLPGFPATPSDCRSLLEPIDFVVFRGLSTKGRVEAVDFVEVKSGRSSLNRHQRQVRDAVNGSRLDLVILELGEEP